MIDKQTGSHRRQIVKRIQVLCGASMVLLFCFLLLVAGCGGGNNNLTSAGPANATINTGDATNDQVLAFELTINSLTLTGKDSSGNSINPSVLSHPTEVEFSHEAGTFEPLSLAQLPPGTYTGATVGVANPEVVAVVSGVPTKLTVTLSTSTVPVNFPSPITITSSNSTVINFDLDLTNSLTISGTSATVTPTFNVTTSTVNMNNEDNNDGEIEDVHGTVTAVAASATPPTFSINTASGASITFQVNSNTQFNGDGGFSSLSQLVVGAIVEVDGITQSDGSKLATKVEAEENEGANGEEAEGIITGVSGTPPADALTVAAQLASMSGSSPSVAGNTFTINTTSNTQFVVRADKLNLSSPPPFDATNIGKGQRIEADIKTGDVSNNASVNADSVKLREQAVIGTIAATPAPTSNSFTVTLSATSAFGTISGTTSIPVTMVSGTEVKPGTSLTAGSPIRVRGLIFFNATANTYSMIAARIDSNN